MHKYGGQDTVEKAGEEGENKRRRKYKMNGRSREENKNKLRGRKTGGEVER
jgi:hypothetical protein